MNIFNQLKYLCVPIIILLSISCVSSKLAQIKGSVPIGLTIAFAPSGGELADAMDKEFVSRGFRVIDRPAMSNLMAKHGIIEKEFSKPDKLEILRKEGIDAIITVDAITGYDQEPDSATVRVIKTTSDGAIIASISWQNGKGGDKGSIADGWMRKDVFEAAKEIAKGLIGEKLLSALKSTVSESSKSFQRRTLDKSITDAINFS